MVYAIIEKCEKCAYAISKNCDFDNQLLWFFLAIFRFLGNHKKSQFLPRYRNFFHIKVAKITYKLQFYICEKCKKCDNRIMRFYAISLRVDKLQFSRLFCEKIEKFDNYCTCLVTISICWNFYIRTYHTFAVYWRTDMFMCE